MKAIFFDLKSTYYFVPKNDNHLRIVFGMLEYQVQYYISLRGLSKHFSR